MTKWLKYCAGK